MSVTYKAQKDNIKAADIILAEGIASHYVPEPYNTIITRLGNAYGTGFFINEACLCCAVILLDTATRMGHSAKIKLVLEDRVFLHHAFIEIMIDGTVYDLDIHGLGASKRSMKGLENGFVNIVNSRPRQNNEDYLQYLTSLTKRYGMGYNMEYISGRKDPTTSYPFIQKIAFDIKESA